MKKIFLICHILFIVVSGYAADNNGTIWSRGNAFYKEKQYDSAAVYYEKLAALKPANAEVYFNLGDTYYRLNKVGMAVLNYERALRLEPENNEVKENLLLTKSRMANYIQQANDIFFITWWANLTRPDRATLWAVLAFITFSAIILILFLRRLPKSIIYIPVQVTGILWFVWVCCMVVAVASAQNSRERSTAVVMQNDAPLMNAELKGKPLSLLPEGTTLKINATRGDYAEVTLPDGRKGWVQLTWLVKV
ncbi:MAG: tetratricopeptide repeat protein [Taibaiella sp.]|nr:tetratricopeptide repeat protein [Taibaiella sp.]